MTIYTRPAATTPVWAESGDKVQPTNPEIESGWPFSSVPPSRQRFNWILGFLAQGVRYLLQRGIAEWAAGEDYPLNARVQYLGSTYVAKMASPTSAPGVVPGEWEAWGLSSTEILPRVGSVLTKSVAGASDVVLSATEFDNGTFLFTGALTGNVNVVVPNTARQFVVRNGTSGAFTLSVKTAASAAVAIPSGHSKALYCDGANNVRVSEGGARTWQDLTASRVLGTPYTNTTGADIEVAVTVGRPTGVGVFTAVVGGVTVADIASDVAAGLRPFISFSVPPGASYTVQATSGLIRWAERRA